MLATFLCTATLLQSATTPVRIVNAVVDTSPVVVMIGGRPWGTASYGARSAYMDVPAGKQTFSIETQRGERLANPVEVALQAGYPHTVIFAGRAVATGRVNSIVLRDTTAGRPSTSSVQIMFVNAMSDATTAVVTINGKETRPKSLSFGSSTSMMNLTPRDAVLVLSDPKGKELFRTEYKLRPATRVTFIAMGAQGLPGNRGPRLFAYEF